MSTPIKLMSIADNEITQAQGLMYVRDLPEMTGMLFKFQQPRVLSFWMMNTYLPLEIAFIDRDNMIVKTERMIPMSTRSVTSGRPCVMALEVMPGVLEKAGGGVGKKALVDFEAKQVVFDD